MDKFTERKERAAQIVAYLKKQYPAPKTELMYDTPFQLLAAVVLSAQCTDKKVNMVTDVLWKKYRTVEDFANADLATLTKETASITYHQTKSKHLIAAAQMMLQQFGGEVPKTEVELTKLPGVGYKTAHVVLGELYDTWEGVPTDTHVRRFAIRFDLTDQTDLTKISKDLESLIPKEDWKYVNNGLVLYGRYECPALPHDCAGHPLSAIWPESGKRWPKAK